MKEIKEFYNKYPYPKANQYTSNQIRTNRKIILGILKTANLTEKDLRNKRILDAGCGTGEKSIFFSKAGAEVIAIDFSKGQLEEAKKKAQKEKIKNISFIEKDILKDNLEDLGKFDIIVSLGVLHHTENPQKAFTSIVGRLKENGIIVVGLYHKYSRLRYRLQRWLLRTFISKDPDKIVDYLYSTKRFHNASRLALYDRYTVPQESYHSLKEVNLWFKKNNIKMINHKNIKNEKLEILNLFEKKTIFFVSGIKVK